MGALRGKNPQELALLWRSLARFGSILLVLWTGPYVGPTLRCVVFQGPVRIARWRPSLFAFGLAYLDAVARGPAASPFHSDFGVPMKQPRNAKESHSLRGVARFGNWVWCILRLLPEGLRRICKTVNGKKLTPRSNRKEERGANFVSDPGTPNHLQKP